jgi:hypothetical protein
MPAVAGSFYPDQQQVLSAAVLSMLQSAALRTGRPAQAPKAQIVPHAGYVYSGATAALAYAQLAAVKSTVKKVVLLGPVHRVAVRGLALPGVDTFQSPLGKVELDLEAVAAITPMPQVVTSAAAHAKEHSLEVQLPFLQSVLDDFKLVPLAVGNVHPREVAQVLRHCGAVQKP